MTTHSMYRMVLRPRRKRGGEGGRRRRGRGILDGPLYTQHALFGMRPAKMPAYGVGRRRKRRTGGFNFRKTVATTFRPIHKHKYAILKSGQFAVVKKHKTSHRGTTHPYKYSLSRSGVGRRRTVHRRPVYVSRMGMGRRRRRRGGAISRGQLVQAMKGMHIPGLSHLQQAHRTLQEKKVISRGLHHLSKVAPHPILAKVATAARNFAATQGYGRRRRVHRGYGPGIMTGMGRRRKRRVAIRKPTMAQIASMGVAGMGRRRKRRRVGGSIFSDIGDFLKKHKILSTIGKAITPLSGMFSPLVSEATKLAEQHGYGRRKHHLSAMHPRHHLKHHKTHHGVGLRHHSAHHMRRGGNNPYPTTNSFYGKPVF